jgi:hypothetical protein
MNRPSSPRPLPRRLVLATALVAGIVVASFATPPASHRAELELLVPPAHAQAAPPAAKADPAPSTPPAPPAAEPDASRADAEVTIDSRGVRVRKGGMGGAGDAAVTIEGQDFESFEQFVEQAPWLAGLVFMVVALVFLVPLLLIVIVIWYKVRRTRMVNEAMLKLAERGAIAPADAMEAIASGRAAPALERVAPGVPLPEQAKALRRSAAWSDLRKGVLIGGFGLGLTVWSMLDDGSANGFGLIMLFVGIGYAILWYLEDRPMRDRLPPSGGGA